jgi:hypothetical protein
MSSPAQQALDIVTELQGALANGAAQSGTKFVDMQILAALALCAQGVLGATPASVSVDAGSFTQTDVASTTSDVTPQQ